VIDHPPDVNTEIDNLKATVVKLIKAGIPVFFGCDVGKHSTLPSVSWISSCLTTRFVSFLASSEYILMATSQTAFNIKLGMTKKQRLQVNESAMTHAMVICGVHVDPETGKPVRYKVENSWGERSGEKGWFMMTDEWFSEYVFQIVVPKALLPRSSLRCSRTVILYVLPAWDPMGSLA
jgi:bleomycin hydrolase